MRTNQITLHTFELQTMEDLRELDDDRRYDEPELGAPAIALQVVVSPDRDLAGSTIALGREARVFGRGSDAGGVQDPLLSRSHVKFKVGSGGEIIVEDLDSRNGTFVDGERISGKRIIAPDALPAMAGADPDAAHEIAGQSMGTRRLRRAVATVAKLDDPVLILGESGTGKDITARAIHRLSGREGPFVAVNCAAIPEHLAEAELFGHRRGAFTGADSDRGGLFVQASGGTLFLDEIGELPLPLQAKLLRVLEDGKVTPIGGTTSIAVDVRVIAATNAELSPASFRRDLRARLDDWTLHLLPLRERRADILPLLDLFSGGAATRHGTSLAFVEAMLRHDWPLNAREVRKLARRLIALSNTDYAWRLGDLPDSIRMRAVERAPSEADVPSYEMLKAALLAAGGNVSQVAQQLGCDRKQVYRWMNRYGFEPRSFRHLGASKDDE